MRALSLADFFVRFSAINFARALLIGAVFYNTGALTLAPSTELGKSSGLAFPDSQYAAGAHAEGQYVGLAPWEMLKPFLTAEGQRIFGGARPKGDADDQQ